MKFNLPAIIETLLLDQIEYTPQEWAIRRRVLKDFIEALKSNRTMKLYQKFWHELHVQEHGKVSTFLLQVILTNFEEEEDTKDLELWKLNYNFYFPTAYHKNNIADIPTLSLLFKAILDDEAMVYLFKHHTELIG